MSRAIPNAPAATTARKLPTLHGPTIFATVATVWTPPDGSDDRHFLLYRTRPDGRVEIGRVLHDSMDLERHLPDNYRAPETGD